MKFLRFIRCWAGGQVYALDMTRVRTIQRVDRLQREVGEAGQVGWLEVAGQRVAVWSLADRLGVTAVAPTESQRVIVLNDPTRPWGLLVERVAPVETAVAHEIHLLPAMALNPANPYFDRVIRHGADLLLLLSPDCLHPEIAGLPAASLPTVSSEWPAADSRVQNRQSAKTQNGQHGQMVVFKLPQPIAGDEALSFALSITQALELLEPLPIIPVPGAADFVQGLVLWRQRPVPLIDLGQRLGAPTNDKQFARTRLMIVRTAGLDELVGFLVNPAVQVVRLPLAHKLLPQPVYLADEMILGCAGLDDELLVVPDMFNVTAV